MQITTHVYTLHHTYTGEHCAMCGRPFSEHEVQDRQLVDGQTVSIEPQDKNSVLGGQL